MPEGVPPGPFQKLAGRMTLAVVVFLGIIAYLASPAASLLNRGVFISLASVVGGIALGYFVTRMFRRRVADRFVAGFSLWFGGMMSYPAFHYIHENTDWVFHHGAAEYSLSSHTLSVTLAAVVLVVGRSFTNE